MNERGAKIEWLWIAVGATLRVLRRERRSSGGDAFHRGLIVKALARGGSECSRTAGVDWTCVEPDRDCCADLRRRMAGANAAARARLIEACFAAEGGLCRAAPSYAAARGWPRRSAPSSPIRGGSPRDSRARSTCRPDFPAPRRGRGPRRPHHPRRLRRRRGRRRRAHRGPADVRPVARAVPLGRSRRQRPGSMRRVGGRKVSASSELRYANVR